MAQARLISMSEDIARDIDEEPEKYVTNVDHTGHLIASASELIAQAHFAELIAGQEALKYAEDIVRFVVWGVYRSGCTVNRWLLGIQTASSWHRPRRLLMAHLQLRLLRRIGRSWRYCTLSS
jgi:hypothetical protein